MTSACPCIMGSLGLDAVSVAATHRGLWLCSVMPTVAPVAAWLRCLAGSVTAVSMGTGGSCLGKGVRNVSVILWEQNTTTVTMLPVTVSASLGWEDPAVTPALSGTGAFHTEVARNVSPAQSPAMYAIRTLEGASVPCLQRVHLVSVAKLGRGTMILTEDARNVVVTPRDLLVDNVM